MAAAGAVPGTEIVAVDSMQVYRGMDIGTAKPTPAERAAVPHHGIDLCDPGDDFTVTEYRAAYDEAIDRIDARGARALLVAGTGLYLTAVLDRLDPPGRFPDVAADLEDEPDTSALHGRLEDLDPVAAAKIEPGNRRRVVRALEVTHRERPPVQLVRTRRRRLSPDRRRCSSACAGRAPRSPTASRRG